MTIEDSGEPDEAFLEDQEEPLLERNLLAFARAISPEFAQRLAGVTSDIHYDRRADNVFVGEASMYPGTATELAATQVADYLKSPTRLSLRPAPPAPGPIRVNDTFAASIVETFGDQIQAGERDPNLINGYLVSFGIGAAKHIPRLVYGLNVERLILVDQSLAFLRISLESIDWAGVIDTLAQRGGSIDVIADEDPLAATHSLYQCIRERGVAFLDGSYLFGHYNSKFFDAIQHSLIEIIPIMADSEGFLEDELLMLTNAAKNLPGGISCLMDRARLDPDIPSAIIVGSGPSIDGHLDIIKRLRADRLLISGGTGLGVLLEAGIKPDIHCEIENVPDIATVNKTAAETYDLSGIHLVAALTVDPDVVKLYDSVSFVLRDILAPTHLLDRDDLVLPMAGPTVTHLACRTALALGVETVALFGVDLGTTEPSRHHSQQSIYARSEDPYWQSGALMETLTIPTRGNLREHVFTSRDFSFARLYFSALARLDPTRRFINCSDGVLIEGTQSCPAEDLVLPKNHIDVTAMLLRGCQPLEDPEFAAKTDRVLEQTRQALEDRVEALSTTAPTLEGLKAAVLLDEGCQRRDGETTPWYMLTGSLTIMLQIANSTLGRMSEADRIAALPIIKEKLISALQDLARAVRHYKDMTAL